MFALWPCPLPGGGVAEENARIFDAGRQSRLLFIPPLFDEHNKLRHQLVEVMQRLDASGVDCFLPDLPGCNESTACLTNHTLDSWRTAVQAAVEHFRISHVLAVRGGGLLVPAGLPGWLYGPVAGKQLLRSMLRARTIASREAGNEENIETLTDMAHTDGITLAGWPIGAQMFVQLEEANKPAPDQFALIEQSELGGGALWLRAEPDFDTDQADALAAILAMGLGDAERAQ